MNIRQKLIALLLFIGLLPTLVVSSIAYIIISTELTNRTADQLTSTAIKQEQKIDEELQKKQEEVSKLANQYDFQVALSSLITSHQKVDHDAIIAILRNKKADIPDIKAINVALLDGSIIASTVSGAEGQKLITQVKPGQAMTSTIKEDTRDGINKLYITTSISLNKKESAIMNVIFRIDDMVATVQDYTGLGATGETVVAQEDSDHNAISLFPLRFNTDAALKTNLNSLAIANNTGATARNLVDYRGQTVMMAARSIQFADWMIATKIDTNEALASTTQLQSALMLTVIASSIAIIVISLFFTRSFTEPILRVVRASRLIGKGDFSVRINLNRNDEVGVLGDSINAMGASLKEFVSHIETQRHRLEIILNSTSESIIAIDKQGVIIIANQATAGLAQRTVSDIVGKPITAIFSWQRELQPFQINYKLPGTTTYSDLEYHDATGARHFVNLIVAQVSGQQEQKEAQTIITIQDETKSRELEAMKVDFVSLAAHELRTPLASIRGYLELISYTEGKAISTDVSKYLQQALKSSDELGSLIDNLLDVTRIENGALTVNMQKVDIAQIAAEAVEDIRSTATQKQLALTLGAPSEGWFVEADRVALREVMDNLLSNAIKYTGEHGRVEVSLTQQGQQYSFSVKDTGIGIPKEALSNLFTKFYRVHGGLSSGSKGSGLGLYIAKSIIERHGGTITVASEEDKGSTFSFSLPKWRERPAGAN